MQPGKARRITGRLTLGIVKIGGNGNDRADKLAAQTFFGAGLDWFKNFG